MQRLVFFPLLLVLFVRAFPLSSAAAEDGCLRVRVAASPRVPKWEMRGLLLENAPVEGLLAADLTGVGRSQLVIRTSPQEISVYTLENGERFEEGYRGPLPETAAGQPLVRSGAAAGTKDLLSWGTRSSVSFLSLDHTPSGAFRSTSWFQELPQNVVLSAKRFDWRCTSSDAPSVHAMFEPCGMDNSNDCHLCAEIRSPDIGPNARLMAFSKGYSLEGAGDFFGTDEQQLLLSAKERSLWGVLFGVAKWRNWANISRRVAWKSVAIGDFDGDRLADVMVVGDPFQSAVIAYSDMVSVYERAIRPPFPSAIDTSSVISGDFDGDGLSDLAAFALDGAKRKVVVALNRSGSLLEEPVFLLALQELQPPIFRQRIPYFLSHFEGREAKAETEFCGFERGTFLLAAALRSSPVVLRPVSMVAGRRALLVLEKDAEPKRFSDSDGARGVHHPRACIGYNPQPLSPMTPKWGMSWALCPEGYGYYGVDEGGKNPKQNGIFAACCPLPADDILTSRTTTSTDVCPDGSIATGVQPTNPACKDCEIAIRCTEVNTERYLLGPPSPGVYWGRGFSSRGQTEQLQESDLPVALRFGIARTDLNVWGREGCIGQPVGSLLVSKAAKYCRDSIFRELFYRGAPGDPPRGTPVKMYPQCSRLEGVFEPEPRCISERD